MLALSLWQPWATALCTVKDIENRDWPLPARVVGQPVAIHAAKRTTNLETDFAVLRGIARDNGIELPEALRTCSRLVLPLGAIVGVVTFDEQRARWVSPWFFGTYGWHRVNPVLLANPVNCRGMQGFWTLDPTVERAVRAQLEGSQ